MAENIFPLHRCGSCGKPGAPLDLECAESITTVITCEACHDRIQNTLAKVRPVFTAMLNTGVPKDIADDVMTYLLDQWPDP